ncbi:MAG: hypothetical protein ABIT47_01970 [Candidatus Paceibacterota bacterium]
MEPTDDQLLEIFNSSPKPIQDSLTEGAAIDFILKVADRYKLHIDVAGDVTEYIRNMLLGILKPEDFVGKLQFAGVPEPIARQLTADLNKEVFVPLRDEIRKIGGAAPAPQPSTLAQVPVMQVGSANDVPTPAPQTSPVVTPPTPQEPPAYNLIRPESQAPVQAPVAQEATMIQPARTMAGDVDALTHPKSVAPASLPGTMPTVPHPWQTSPAQSFQTASVPYTSMPVNSRAVPAPPPIEIPRSWSPAKPAELPLFKPQASQAPVIARPEPLTKEYGSDPYREQIS